MLAQQQGSGYQAGQQNPLQATQHKRLGAAPVSGNPASQQVPVNSGVNQLGVRQQPGVTSQQGPGYPGAVNQGNVQPQNPQLPQQAVAPSQYAQQMGTAANAYAQQGANGQPGYAPLPQMQNAGVQGSYGSGNNVPGYNAGAVGVNAVPVQNQVASNSVGRTAASVESPPSKKLEVLKDVADPKLPESECKKILKDGGCKVALDLDLDISVARR